MNNMKMEYCYTLAEVLDRKTEWECFYNNLQISDLYFDPDYYINFISNNKHDCYVVFVYNNKSLVSVLPFFLRYKNFDVKFSVISLLGCSFKTLVYSGSKIHILGDDIKSIELALIADKIRKIADCDVVVFEYVSDFDQYVLSGKSNYLYSKSPNDIVRLVKHDGDYAEFIGRLKRKTRYNLNRSRKQYMKSCTGNLVRVFENKSDCERLISDCSHIYKMSWHSRYSKKLCFSEEQSRQIQSLSEAGLQRSYVLYCNNSPIAYIKGYISKSTYYYDEIAFDSNYKSSNPGNVLNLFMFEDLFDGKRAQVINFGPGENIYKSIFGTDTVVSRTYFLAAKSSRFYAVFVVNSILESVYKKIYKALTVLRLRSHFKKFLKG